MGVTRRLAGSISDYQNPRSLGARFRARRLAPLLEMIEQVHGRAGAVNIVDLGGTETYWRILADEYLDRYNVAITLVNLPGDTTLADHGRFTFLAADACDLGTIPDDAFDIVHSNSVIEHVGDWERMARFAAEVRRLAPNYFVQTPNYWFPLEPHCMTPFYHWLPKPMRVWLVLHLQLGHWPKAATTDDAVRSVESARLLNRRMLSALFPDAEIVPERIAFLAKSFVAVRASTR